MIYEFTSYSGLATVALDYTSEFWPLGVMLFGLVVLSGAIIALAAIKHSLSQRRKPVVTTTSSPHSYDTAA